MNQPKLKYPRLCRILTYVVVIGAGILPIILVFQFPVPNGVKVVVLPASLCGLLVYLFWNFFPHDVGYDICNVILSNMD